MEIRAGGLDHPDVVALLEEHFAEMLAASPPGTCHFLDLTKLAADTVHFFTAWDGETLLGCGAFQALSDDHGEIKSMRTTKAALRRGVAAALLSHIEREARAHGIRQLSLETGTGGPFEAAHGLYRRFGYGYCPPFGDYEATDFNVFMTRTLD